MFNLDAWPKIGPKKFYFDNPVTENENFWGAFLFYNFPICNESY